MSGWRSSSISTLTWGRSPPDSSSRSAIAIAIPPIEPTCRSSTARSGVRSATSLETNRPSRHTVKLVSGPPSAAVTSSTIQSASVASRMCTTPTLYAARAATACSGQLEMGSDVIERLEIMHVGRQQRYLDRGLLGGSREQRCERVALGGSERLQLGEVVPQRRLLCPRRLVCSRRPPARLRDGDVAASWMDAIRHDRGYAVAQIGQLLGEPRRLFDGLATRRGD